MTEKYQGSPLDEIQFRHPGCLQYWGGYRADTVHPIIKESPFFDHTTKNGVLWDQAPNDFRLWETCHNRHLFEARLRSMNGVEYMIVNEPQKDDTPFGDSGVWTIRKQNREKKAGGEDVITVLATYYIVGDNMYQAPSVYDILGNHMLSAYNSMTKLVELVKDQPLFAPALGHTYFPPISATNTQTPALDASREPSAAPSQSNATNPTATPDPRESYALLESFQMTMHYGDEYMDENPLRGEPGNFTFTATKERIRAKQAEAEAAKVKQAQLAKKLAESRAAGATVTATPFGASTTAAKVKADAATADGKPVTKRAKSGDKKKKRNRNATSPMSPMTPATPATPAS